MTKNTSKPVKHYLTPNWDAPANVHAAMTLRTGGVSTGVYSSLNPASHVADDSEAVQENRAIIKRMLDLPSEPVWLEQIHSNIVVQATKSDVRTASPLKDWQSYETADASFTNQSGVVCAVLTADCLPLALCSKDGEKVAAVHAGWKGLLGGIITNTVTALATRELLVWLAPAIGAEKFEVGSEVRELFINKNPEFAAAFRPHAPEKWLADIYQLARIELANLGVTDIYGGDRCTMTEATQFYSYRRDNITGRMATLIWKD